MNDDMVSRAPLDGPLSLLLSPHLDALFWRPARLGVDSAWYGHLPFAHWLVASGRPRVLVELGTHAGVSYSGFCEAAQRSGLATRCLAVDTWHGDEHAGFYGEEVFADLRGFHDSRYGSFSTLLRATFDEALDAVDDGSIDLLHIDGRHHYDDVRHDFQTWLPKLSDRGVVLFHDTCVRERDFGVWRLWREITPGRPHFEFLHAHGLGVLCTGEDAPEPILRLCALDDAALVGQVRECFALLGERWVLESANRRLEQAVAEQHRHADLLNAKFSELSAYVAALEGHDRPPPAGELRNAIARALAAENQRQQALVHAARAEATAEAEVARARAEAEARVGLAQAEAEARVARVQTEAEMRVAAARDEVLALRRELDAIAASRSWALASRVRAARDVLRRAPRHPLGLRAEPPPQPEPEPQAWPAPEPAPDTEPEPLPEAAPEMEAARPSPTGRVLFAIGEPGTPGSIYRCRRYAAWAAADGWDARCKIADEINADDLRDTDIVILWRVTWSEHIKGVIEHVHMFGGRVGLDLDDLMVRPELARIEYIDAIRSINWSETHVRGMFVSVLQVLQQVDFATATTTELAAEMRRWQKAAYVLPNGFDEQAWHRSRRAARARAAAPDDGLVRIGYAGGSRTHQRDFAEAAPGIAAVLRARPQARLVLFRSESDSNPLLSLDEFPDFADLSDRIEWRTMVELEALPDELARFDINVVPLQTGNPFVEAKSELKLFEAAIAGVPTIASPTAPYRRAVIDGQTGLLADNAAEWEAALLRLIDDAALRRHIALQACSDVLWRFGPVLQSRRLARVLAQECGPGSAEVADAFVRGLSDGMDGPRLPPLTAAETLFAHDRLGEAAVTVIIASYNYADFIQQALDSVRLQTLEAIDLVVVDDCSPDPETMRQILDWAHVHAERFNRLIVLRHATNAGLGATRNTGFARAETPYVLPLDADNRLRPDCAERLLAVLADSDAAYAYPRLQHFGAEDRITGGERYQPQRLIGGNYIDAMALIARWAWSAAGGYYVQRDAMGWEDYALWCRLAELGCRGQAVDEVLAEYRVHAESMVNSITETTDNKRAMVAYVERRHPWLQVVAREAYARK